MAKVKSAGLRNYVGRLAGSVYYVVKGQNMAREVAAQVTNPKTQLQMMQRVRLANLVNFYRANKEWMKKYSFETLTGLKTIYNEFISQNLTNISAPLTKKSATEGVVVPDFLKLTKGSLSSIGAVTNWAAETVAMTPFPLLASDNSIGALSKHLIETNGFKENDQLSIIVIKYMTGKPCEVSANEIIIDSASSQALPGYISQMSGFMRILIEKSIDVTNANGFAVCLIHSRRENGKVLVSSEVLSLSPNARAAQLAASSKRAFELAIESYGYTNEPFLDPSSNALSEKYIVSVVESNEGTITGAGSYDYGTEVTIQATPNAQYSFDGWAAPFNGKPNPFTLKVVENVTIKANYSQTE